MDASPDTTLVRTLITFSLKKPQYEPVFAGLSFLSCLSDMLYYSPVLQRSRNTEMEVEPVSP